MQVRVRQDGPVIRIQRDGPSPLQQAHDAGVAELQAQVVSITARMQALTNAGAAEDAQGRATLQGLREELLATTARLRELESQRHEQAFEQAITDRMLGQATATQPARPEIPEIPQGAVDISLGFFIAAAAAIVLFPLMRSLGRILERRAAPPQRLAPDLESQLQRMEQAIDTVAVEVERIAEGQRYTARLLTDREHV